ncbi:MAG: hypothetical protein ABJA10_00050, partial [Aestuariivirga sp.]
PVQYSHIVWFRKSRSGHSESINAHVLNQILKNTTQLIEKAEALTLQDSLALFLPMIERVDFSSGQMTINIRLTILREMIGMKAETLPTADPAPECYLLCVPSQAKRRGVETHVVLTNGLRTEVKVDHTLLRSIAKAHVWFNELSSDSRLSIKAIAARENILASEVSRQLPLAFLAPKIVSAILRGRQPIDLTTKRIQRAANLPIDWNEQAQMLSFNEI